MWARFTVLNETPIASAIAGCVIPLSRSNTIWMRSRCAAGIFHRRAVFSCRICFLVHLTIPPEPDGQSESYYQLECEPEKYRKSAIQTAMEAVLHASPSIYTISGESNGWACEAPIERRNNRPVSITQFLDMTTPSFTNARSVVISGRSRNDGNFTISCD